MGTIYFLRVNCAEHGRGASGGDLICAYLLGYRALVVDRFIFKDNQSTVHPYFTSIPKTG